jgi:hypothetical protein
MSESGQNPDFVMNPGEKTTVLFMQMVFQLSSLATMLLGKVPHPETGKTQCDLEAAQVIIDQLDMLQAKTKGNLTQEEEQMLKQTLMGLRMAYVEAVNHPQTASPESEPSAGQESAAAPESEPTPPEAEPAPASPPAEPSASAPEDAESKKRFTKKY